MNDEDKILSFPTAEPMPTNPLGVDQNYWNSCSHDQVTLDQKTRTVFCVKCSSTLDPFNFLLSNAKTIQQAWTHHAHVMAKVKELHVRAESMAKEVKRIQGTLKTLQQKEKATGSIIDVRGREL